MLLRQINYFQAVVRLNSFTEAAAECHISQSAVSQQIRVLEQELGVTLLQRSGRRFTLPPAGEYFYRKSLILTADLDRLVRETVHLAHRDDEKLCIGYLNSYEGPEVQLAVAAFSEQYPDIPIRTAQGTHEELFRTLREGTVDILLSDQNRVCSDAYVHLLLTSSNCCVELSSRNPIARLDCVTLDELKNTPCILVASQEQQAAEQDYYRDILGFSGDFLFANHLNAARLMVAANQGFLPVMNSSPLAQFSASIRRLPLLQHGRPIRYSLCAFWKADSPAFHVNEFAEMLKDQFSSNSDPQ